MSKGNICEPKQHLQMMEMPWTTKRKKSAKEQRGKKQQQTTATASTVPSSTDFPLLHNPHSEEIQSRSH